MLETISEWATIYFEVGAILGFGIGALAQLLKGTSREWTFVTCLCITVAWPQLFYEAWTGRKK